MKKYLLISFFAVLSFLISNQGFAVETQSLQILLDPAYEAKICPSPLFKNTAIAWGGVKDERESKDLSVIYKKEQAVMSFQTDKPLADYYDEHLQTVLKRCGMNLVATNAKHELTVVAHIQEFTADMNKTLTKSQTQADSRLVLTFDGDYVNYDVNIGFEMDSNSASFKNKKKLQKTMSELFFGTLNEMIRSDQLKFLKK